MLVRVGLGVPTRLEFHRMCYSRMGHHWHVALREERIDLGVDLGRDRSLPETVNELQHVSR